MFALPLPQYVYVDEAQDLCMAQLGLLTLLCKDATSGLVIAGDTAQTITKGAQAGRQTDRQTDQAAEQPPVFEFLLGTRTDSRVLTKSAAMYRFIVALLSIWLAEPCNV
jgi:hypothetical protein